MKRCELEQLLNAIYEDDQASYQEKQSAQSTLRDRQLLDLAEQNSSAELVNQLNDHIDAVMLVHPRDQADIFNRCSFLENKDLLMHCGEKVLSRSCDKDEVLEILWPLILDAIKVPFPKIHYNIPVLTLPLAPDYWLPPLDKGERRSYSRKMKVLRERQKDMVKILSTLWSATSFPIILGALTGRMVRNFERANLAGPFLTGNYLTPFLIEKMIRKVAEIASEDPDLYEIALVGGAGNMGSNILRWLLHINLGSKITVVDIDKRKLQIIEEEFSSISTTDKMEEVQGKDIVIVATAAPQVLVMQEMLSPGTIVINDTHPSNVAEGISGESVVVLDVMAHVPGIKYNFPMSQLGETDVVTCAAEGIVALKAKEADFSEVKEHNQIVRLIQLLSQTAKEMGVTFAEFREGDCYISEEEIKQIRALVSSRG